jgi:hypothetical protein
MATLSMPPLAVIQDDRDRWDVVVPLGLALTIVDGETVSELVVQTVYTLHCCPQ